MRFDRLPRLRQGDWEYEARDMPGPGSRICFEGGGIAVSVANKSGAEWRVSLLFCVVSRVQLVWFGGDPSSQRLLVECYDLIGFVTKGNGLISLSDGIKAHL